jgi:hypothetical protein
MKNKIHSYHISLNSSQTEDCFRKSWKKIETHILCSILLFENRAVYEIMWKNVVQQGRPQIKIWRMRIACWITMASHTLPQYVILIAFSPQQLLQERASMGTLHAHCLSCYVLTISLRPRTNKKWLANQLWYAYHSLRNHGPDICNGEHIEIF